MYDNMSYAEEYADALRQLRIPEWPALHEKLSTDANVANIVQHLRSYLAAHHAHREAWKVFANGGHHSQLDMAYDHKINTLEEWKLLLS